MPEIKSPNSSEPEKEFRILVLGNGHRKEIEEECLQHGYEVVSVRSANEALDFLESHDHVDAAIAPAFMESGSVFDFLLGLRRMPENAHAPLMILSAEPSQLATYCTPAVESAAKLLGAYKFITMPEFNLNQVIRELQAILPNRPAKLERQQE